MNTGVGDAIDLSWKLAATLCGWGGPGLLASYEVERRQVGDRNVAAARYASTGRRRWRGLWRPEFGAMSSDAPERTAFARIAKDEQRKSNEMIGAELGYRYIGSPVIWDEPGGPEHSFRTYDPTAWTGVRLPHAWVGPGRSLQDLPGRAFTLLQFAGDEGAGEPLLAALAERGAPTDHVRLADARLRDLYGRDLLLLRPDLHIAWRGDALPEDVAALAQRISGW
jgi:hypothetical protein